MTEIRLYNTKTRTKSPFLPEHSPVAMYCCGPTVYNYAHIGNMRTYIFEDVLKRTLLSAGYSVRHVMNITDVGHLTDDGDNGDDKMEKGAVRENVSVWEIANFYTEAFMQDIQALNILIPDSTPKASDHIPEMISMIQTLTDKGFTYKTSDGIYFDTTKFPTYSDFARLDTDNLQEGNRVTMRDKRHKTDFALWKFSPTDKKRAMEWDSPWGIGFPGWHIECSAMSLKHLPQPLDIHCGGVDHVPIHHSNEIAQAEAATEKPYCSTWIHGEFLVMNSGKMSKSNGTFLTVKSLQEENIAPLAFRYFCFSTHYRKQLTFSMENIKAAATGLSNLRSLVRKSTYAPTATLSTKSKMADFYNAVYDDMNIPKALAWLWDTLRGNLPSEAKYEITKEADTILGLDLFRTETQSQSLIDGITFIGFKATDEAELPLIAALIRQREEARTQKNWAQADTLRDTISTHGVEITDNPNGAICQKCNNK